MTDASRYWKSIFALVGLIIPIAAMADSAPDTIKIAAVSSFVDGHIRLTGIDAVIEQQGWLRSELAKRGLKFEWYPAPNAAVGPIINEAFSNHLIQFAGYSDLPSIILNGSGAATTKLLLPTNPTDAYLIVPEDSSAKSIDDLKGKRLAVMKGRPWEIPLLRLLDSKGLSYSDFQLYNLNPDVTNTAIATGSIDGAVTPQAFDLEAKGVAKIIWSTKNEPLDWKSWGGIWGAGDYVQQHPDITQLVVTAYVKADYWASQPQNHDAVIHLFTLGGRPVSVIQRTYDNPSGTVWKNHWSPLFVPALYAHYREDIAYALNKKIIQKDIDVDSLLDPSFAQEASKELGLAGYWVDPDTTQATAKP